MGMDQVGRCTPGAYPTIPSYPYYYSYYTVPSMPCPHPWEYPTLLGLVLSMGVVGVRAGRGRVVVARDSRYQSEEYL